VGGYLWGHQGMPNVWACFFFFGKFASSGYLWRSDTIRLCPTRPCPARPCSCLVRAQSRAQSRPWSCPCPVRAYSSAQSVPSPARDRAQSMPSPARARAHAQFVPSSRSCPCPVLGHGHGRDWARTKHGRARHGLGMGELGTGELCPNVTGTH